MLEADEKVSYSHHPLGYSQVPGCTWIDSYVRIPQPWSLQPSPPVSEDFSHPFNSTYISCIRETTGPSCD